METQRMGKIRRVLPLMDISVHAIASGFYVTLLSAAVMFILIQVAAYSWNSIIVVGISVLGLSLLWMAFYEHEFRTVPRAVSVGCCFGIGFSILPAYFLLHVSPIHALLAIVPCALLFCIVAILVRFAVRAMGFQRLVQDGTLCPFCGYSLLGQRDIESSGCPECGETFTFEEMGTTAELFLAQQRESGVPAGLEQSPRR